MKKLVVLFIAIMFLSTFTLIGCNQSSPPPAPAEKGAPGAAGAPGAPGAPGAAGAPGATGGGWCAWSNGSACASTRKIGDAGHRSIPSPRGYTPMSIEGWTGL